MNKHGMCCRSLGLLALGTVTIGFAVPASGKGHIVRTEKVFRAAPPAGGGVAGDGCTYANDDGASTNAFGVVGGGGVGSAAGYVAVDGCVTIDTIQVAWGPVTDGQACTLQIYKDPNEDGDPSDLTPADRLASVAGVVANPDTDIFNDYAIPPVVVSGIFWVVAITEDSGDDFPLQVDGDDPVSSLNYILLGIDDVNDPFALTTTVLQEESNVMVRATGPGMEVSCFGGDTNGDCQVNVTDLVNVISAWGTAGISLGSYDADLNDDGTVDVTDLVGGVITNWGSCDCAFRACCFQDGTCADITPDGCFRLGGEIQSAGSDCSSRRVRESARGVLPRRRRLRREPARGVRRALRHSPGCRDDVCQWRVRSGGQRPLRQRHGSDDRPDGQRHDQQCHRRRRSDHLHR